MSSRIEGSTSTINHGPREEFTLFPPAGISQLSVSTTQVCSVRKRPLGAVLSHTRGVKDLLKLIVHK